MSSSTSNRYLTSSTSTYGCLDCSGFLFHVQILCCLCLYQCKIFDLSLEQSTHIHNTRPITQRAISLQKVHLWMEISAGCPHRGRRSLTKMDRPGNVQSSVWTLQQILPDRPMKLHLHPIHPSGLTTAKKLTNFHCVS